MLLLKDTAALHLDEREKLHLKSRRFLPEVVMLVYLVWLLGTIIRAYICSNIFPIFS
jgi:predicted branched-subunit amino acid permease